MNDALNDNDVAATNELPLAAVDLTQGTHQARQRCLREYQDSALKKEDPLSAVLSFMNGDLMQIAFEMKDTIQEVMADEPRTLEGLYKVVPAVDIYLRVTRQIDRFTQVEQRAEGARQRVTPALLAATQEMTSVTPSPSEENNI